MGKGIFTRSAAVAAVSCGLILVAFSAVATAGLPRLKADPDPIRGGRIVDAKGREVILRGVNVNSLGQYWQGTDKPPTLPLERKDPARIVRIGWNLVRLIVSWSRVEPRPGQINRAYLDRVGRWTRLMGEEGIYVILDFHQDAWGPTLAASDDESCTPPSQPAFGWDGAPGWATFDDGQPRCFTNNREVNPAVRAAWTNFFNDRSASDGIGIQTHYVRMLKRVARRFAGRTAVAGIDIMNEPNAFGPVQSQQLGDFYGRALEAIRAGEKAGGGFRHLVFFEPGVLWSLTGSGPPGSFDFDSDVVYSPHLYGGSIGETGPPSRESFETAREEAAGFGGAPVLTGEWGGDPLRADGSGKDYFGRHLKLQDEFLVGSALWTWKQSCGDPHAATRDPEVAPPLPPWSVYRMDCSGSRNRVVGQYGKLVKDLRRPFVRGAPGRITSIRYFPDRQLLVASGTGASKSDGPLELFLPTDQANGGSVSKRGLFRVRFRRDYGRSGIILIWPRGGAWKIRARIL